MILYDMKSYYFFEYIFEGFTIVAYHVFDIEI